MPQQNTAMMRDTMAKDSKNRALEMRKTDNRLSVSKPHIDPRVGGEIRRKHKVAHLPKVNMETRRRQMGQRSTMERLEYYKGDER